MQPVPRHQFVQDRKRLLVGNAKGNVDGCAFKVGGDPALPDAFRDAVAVRLQFAGGEIAVERGAIRIDKADGHVGVQFLQPQTDARHRAPGTSRADETVHAAVHRLVNLWRGGFDVGEPVGDIVELVGPDGPRHVVRQPARSVHIMAGIRIAGGRHQHQFRPQRPQCVLLFLALRFRHHDDRAIPERAADDRQADAGVAGRPLHDGAARPQRAGSFRIPDDPQRGPILDRPAGIHEFAFPVDVAPRALGWPLQPDEGRLADKAGDVVRYPWHEPFLPRLPRLSSAPAA